MAFRDPNLDQLKEGKHLSNARKHRCATTGCNKFLTAYQGPGSETLCRDHQLGLSDYGGMGKLQKEHSHSRKDRCEGCGYAPAEDPRVTAIQDLKIRNQAIRALLDVDHMDGNHGNNDPANLRTLCKICHGIKTIVNQDHRTASRQ